MVQGSLHGGVETCRVFEVLADKDAGSTNL
jgi:hypothetical protein